MDGMNKEHWPGKGYPSSGMEAHIDQFAVGMRISEVPSSIIVNDRLDDDSDVINQRQLDRMHNDNCDTDVCSKCGSPEARLFGTNRGSVKLTASLAKGIVHLPSPPPWLLIQARDRLKEEQAYKEALERFDPDVDEHRPVRPIDNDVDSPTSHSKAMLCSDCCAASYEREYDSFVTRDEKKIRKAFRKLGCGGRR